MLKSKIDKNPFQINMAEFAQGLYFIAVTYPDGWQVTNKITIEK
jgi:hypothetical protein